MTKEGSTKIVIFMTTRVGVLVLRCGHKSHLVKMHFFSPLLEYTRVWIRQIKFIVIKTNGGSNKIVKLHDRRSRGSCAGHGHKVKMQCFFSSCIHWVMDKTNSVLSL